VKTGWIRSLALVLFPGTAKFYKSIRLPDL
jgi:hypothetical protein